LDPMSVQEDEIVNRKLNPDDNDILCSTRKYPFKCFYILIQIE
jgi:hypothetical protein